MLRSPHSSGFLNKRGSKVGLSEMDDKVAAWLMDGR